MRPRPKYKVGDILEYWDVPSGMTTYSIVVDVIGSSCGFPKCKRCNNGKNTYLLKPVQGGEVDDYSIKQVDMIFKHQSTNCHRGWRRVG
jgi:hypothetical protein